jgi:hypothetical protein
MTPCRLVPTSWRNLLFLSWEKSTLCRKGTSRCRKFRIASDQWGAVEGESVDDTLFCFLLSFVFRWPLPFGFLAALVYAPHFRKLSAHSFTARLLFSDDGGSSFFRNVGICLPGYTASHSRKPYSLPLQPWEP